MAEQTTFVKVDRNILQWRWYKVPSTAHLFIYFILRANHEDHDFMGITVHRGELVSSIKHMSDDTGLTVNQVRTALKHLISTNEITSTSTNRYTLISIVNYKYYQGAFTNRITNKPQTKNKRITNRSQQSKNNKKDKNEKNEKNVLSTPQPSDAVAYFAEHGRSEADAMKFFRYNQARGWKINRTPIDDWKAAADIWFDEAPDVGGGSDNAELDAFGKPIQKEFV